MEEAFLWFEVKVMELCNFENIVNGVFMIFKVGMSGDSDVVHINSDRCPKGFVFENDVPIDVVHHSLECCWRIGESKIHDGGFEESVSGFKRCFLLVSFTDAYIVIPPSDVKFHIYVRIAEVAYEIGD